MHTWTSGSRDEVAATGTQTHHPSEIGKSEAVKRHILRSKRGRSTAYGIYRDMRDYIMWAGEAISLLYAEEVEVYEL